MSLPASMAASGVALRAAGDDLAQLGIGRRARERRRRQQTRNARGVVVRRHRAVGEYDVLRAEVDDALVVGRRRVGDDRLHAAALGALGLDVADDLRLRQPRRGKIVKVQRVERGKGVCLIAADAQHRHLARPGLKAQREHAVVLLRELALVHLAQTAVHGARPRRPWSASVTASATTPRLERLTALTAAVSKEM